MIRRRRTYHGGMSSEPGSTDESSAPQSAAVSVVGLDALRRAAAALGLSAELDRIVEAARASAGDDSRPRTLPIPVQSSNPPTETIVILGED
jgi:hypothetical protein